MTPSVGIHGHPGRHASGRAWTGTTRMLLDSHDTDDVEMSRCRDVEMPRCPDAHRCPASPWLRPEEHVMRGTVRRSVGHDSRAATEPGEAAPALAWLR